MASAWGLSWGNAWLQTWGAGDAPQPQPEQQVAVGGGGKSRVWFKAYHVPWERLFEAETEAEALKALRTVKRAFKRRLNRSARTVEPIPEIPRITIRGDPYWLPEFRMRVQEMRRQLERERAEALRRAQDEDDIEVLLL